ncbi:MAG: helix-turn-helix transcriptional regulator [Lachnospiraceae bacterium]|nr:helix-turn-helix transcriptional regulator [Lachnospiraceae bacterium]
MLLITISEILGQRIKYYRKKKKLSQEKLSELADLHPTYIGQLERGEKNASIESLYKISIGLQVPITQLLEKLDEYNPEGYDVVETTNSTNNNIPLKAYELFSSQPKHRQEILLKIVEFSILM